MRVPFEVLEPTGDETPVIVEVPHASLDMAPPFLEPLVAPARALARDADLYVDTLYADATLEGASVIACRQSRYVIDVNRAERDVDSDIVEGLDSGIRLHHGLVWKTTADGDSAWARKLTRAEFDERIEFVWRPYHRALAELIERKRARFGLAVVLAAHSMPSVERPNTRELHRSSSPRDDRSARARADVVPGTRGRRSAARRFIDAVEGHAVERGWSVRHDDPYPGGYTTQHYGRPSDHVHVVQVELARRLYLDEGTLRHGSDFDSVRLWCRQLVVRLGELATAATGKEVLVSSP